MPKVSYNPDHCADIYYLHQEIMGEQFDQIYQGNLKQQGMFETFIHDTDWYDPNWTIVHKAIISDNPVDKVQALNAIREMYEDYVSDVTNEMMEDL